MVETTKNARQWLGGSARSSAYAETEALAGPSDSGLESSAVGHSLRERPRRLVSLSRSAGGSTGCLVWFRHDRRYGGRRPAFPTCHFDFRWAGDS